MVPLEQWTWIPAANRLIVVESIFEAERPVKVQVVGVSIGKFTVLEQFDVMVDKAVAEGGPGEHVDGYGMRS